jgi:hypothetical protein
MNKQIARMPARPRLKDPAQGEFDLVVQHHVERDGIGMGVLRDGTPFLNQRGLARLCGVQNRYIGLISSGWVETEPEPAVARVREILADQGVNVTRAAYETFFGKVRVLAYPDTVCMAILEYFAFDAQRQGEEIAKASYRRLSRYGLKKFIYENLGYESRETEDVWKIFRDRVSLTYDAVPIGYFSVFKELASLIVTLGQNELHIDENFVPDISVGQAWAAHWKESRLEDEFGEAGNYCHNYPDYFPQAASNPQSAACYPEAALPEFRRWFREEYIGEGKFRKYLVRKVSERVLPEGYVERAMLALTRND